MSEELVKEWIVKTEKDYWAAEYLYDRSKKLSTIICFHAQQSAEKYLKVLLTQCNVEPPRIHSLETLLDMVVSEIPELEKYRESLIDLTPFSVEYRYPGADASAEDAQNCIEMIRQLRKGFRKILAPK
jgi:HEPN domain-containing protein